jgi:hypothetical protein
MSKYPKFTTVENLFKEKQTHHKRIAKLSIKEKIEMLVRIQKIAHGLKKKYKVWEI